MRDVSAARVLKTETRKSARRIVRTLNVHGLVYGSPKMSNICGHDDKAHALLG